MMYKKVRECVLECIEKKIPISKRICKQDEKLLKATKYRDVAICFNKMDRKKIEEYISFCLENAEKTGDLKFPKDNRIERLSEYVLGLPFRAELYRVDCRLSKACLEIFRLWIMEHTLSALSERQKLVVENCGYDDIKILDKTKKWIKKCKREGIELGDIYADYGIEKKMHKYYFLNNSVMPLESDEFWIDYIKTVIVQRAERGCTFSHDLSIVGEIFGKEIFSAGLRMVNSRFHRIVLKAKEVILKDYLYIPQSLKTSAEICILNRKSLAPVYDEVYRINSFGIIGFLDRYIIGMVEENEFLNYLYDMIHTEIKEGNKEILSISKKILGVATHSFNESHRGMYPTLEKLFYQAWIESVPEHYSSDEFTDTMFKKANYSEKQKLEWRRKRYEYKARLDEMTLEEVLIRCRQTVDNFISNGRILNRYYFYAELLDAPREHFCNTKMEKIKYQKEIEEFLIPEIRNYEAKLKANNIKIMQNESLKKRIYYKIRESYWSYCIDFSVTESLDCREKVIEYFIENYEYCNDLGIQSLCRDAINVLEIFHCAEEKFGIYLLNQLSAKMIATILHYFEYERKNSPLTVKNKYTSLKKVVLFHFAKGKINNNPCKDIKFHNTDEHVKHTEFIPDEVLEQLDLYITDLPDKYQLLYRLFTETGARFKEIADIRVQDILERTDEGGYILIYPSKVARARYKRGYDLELLKFISLSTYDDLIKYIESKREQREEAQIDYVFFEKTRGRYSSLAPKSYNDVFNDLIRKNDIRAENGKYWHFHSKQTRKTAAVKLINSGAELEDVQQFLGHLSSGTTTSYYAEVKYLTVEKLNTEFFRKKFGVIVGDSMLAKFNEEERKDLYVDFLMKQRELPLGKCIRHPSEGTCSNMSNMVNCASCPRLCTGKKYLDKWNVLLKDSNERVEKMKNMYEEKGIKESHYIFFSEYVREMKIQNAYGCVIDKIKEGVV